MKAGGKPDDNARAQKGERIRDPAEGARAKKPPKGKKTRGPSPAQLLVDLAEEEAQFFQVPRDNRAAYATFPFESHSETWPVESSRFKGFLGELYRLREGRWPSPAALVEAAAVLAMKASIRAPERDLFLRVAQHAGAIYLDLGDPAWRVVHIPPDGSWRIIDSGKAPVRFERSPSMLALPAPKQGGSIDDIRPFLNARREDDWRLMASWLLFTFQPAGPFPVLVIQGEQNSGKSTTSKVLRSLIDPSELDVRNVPKNEEDLMVGARRSWVLAYDNCSGVQQWFSDGLCRISTGSAFGTRRFHSNTEEVFIRVSRPLLLNGIDDMTTRADLGRRAVRIDLPPILDGKRDEREFWKAFNAARPHLLGALCSTLARVLGRRSGVCVPGGVSTMADFEIWGVAVEETLDWPPGSFLRPYRNRVVQSMSENLDGDPVAIALTAFVTNRTSRDQVRGDVVWDGTANDLLEALKPFVPGIPTGHGTPEGIAHAIQSWGRKWPSVPATLGRWLKRNAPGMREQRGIDVQASERSAYVRGWIIRRIGATKTAASEAPARPSHLSDPSQTQDFPVLGRDESGDPARGDDTPSSLGVTGDDRSVTHRDRPAPSSLRGGGDGYDASLLPDHEQEEEEGLQ